MTPRRTGRTQPCSITEARTRFAHARKFLETAELVATEREMPESASVAAALAVLAGIAASDAACCGALKRRSRSQDHHDAEAMVATIGPDGADAASQLKRLLVLKDEAHYGFYNVTASELTGSLRRARALVAFAERVIKQV